MGALLSQTPETVLNLQTFKDIFNIKSRGKHFKTKLQKLQLIEKAATELQKFPYNSNELNQLKVYIDNQSNVIGTPSHQKVSAHFLTAKIMNCTCRECLKLNPLQATSSLLEPESLVNTLIPFQTSIEDEQLQNKIRNLETLHCKIARSSIAADKRLYK